MHTHHLHKGFSLIELMIVVAVIGILAGIAIPNYTEHVTKARITEAVGTLSEARTRMEQYFQDNRTYLLGVNQCPLTAAPLGPINATRHFTFSCVADCDGVPSLPTANGYIIYACGTGVMNNFAYSIDQANTRTTLAADPGWTLTPGCWVLRKGGAC